MLPTGIHKHAYKSETHVLVLLQLAPVWSCIMRPRGKQAGVRVQDTARPSSRIHTTGLEFRTRERCQVFSLCESQTISAEIFIKPLIWVLPCHLFRVIRLLLETYALFFSYLLMNTHCCMCALRCQRSRALMDIDSEFFHYTQQPAELPLFTTPTLMKRLRNGRGVEISDSHSLMAISWIFFFFLLTVCVCVC